MNPVRFQSWLLKLRGSLAKNLIRIAVEYFEFSGNIAFKLLISQSYLSKIRGVLPDKKVARYYQLESTIDAITEYEMAKRIPLVE